MTLMSVLLVLSLALTCNGQTLVHFRPSSRAGYSHGTPIAAGFAYAFRAPIAAKSFDTHNLIGQISRPSGRILRGKTYEVPQERNSVVPVYYAAKPAKNIFHQSTTHVQQPLVIPEVVKTQYHSQDELGQYAYGYVHNDASHHEERSVHGGVTGTYSYYDKDGVKQSTIYDAGRQGFRVHTLNPGAANPVPVRHTPEVEAATFAHLQAVEKVRARKHLGRKIHVGIGETPEVAAARAAHMLAYNKIKQQHAKRWKRSPHRPYNSPSSHGSYNYHQQQSVPNYHAPVQPTAAVQAATYQHLEAVHATRKYGGNVHVGIPDTPAVVAAREAHLHAYEHIAQDHASRWK